MVDIIIPYRNFKALQTKIKNLKKENEDLKKKLAEYEKLVSISGPFPVYEIS